MSSVERALTNISEGGEEKTSVRNCRTLSNIVEHCQTLSNIVEHYRTLLTLSSIAEQSNIVDHVEHCQQSKAFGAST